MSRLIPRSIPLSLVLMALVAALTTFRERPLEAPHRLGQATFVERLDDII